MVATDTVVGVVGAVLLAAVMVGVFVYEYNNAPAGPANDDAGKAVTFAANYPNLEAEGDLDGDGMANFKDPDMDNNGVPDANQTGDLVVRFPFDGSVPAAAPPAMSSSMTSAPIPVHEGNTRIEYTVYYNSTTPAPANTPQLAASLSDGGDPVAGTHQPPANGETAGRVTYSSESGFAAGNVTLTVTASNALPLPGATGATPFKAVLLFYYGSAQPRPVGV